MSALKNTKNTNIDGKSCLLVYAKLVYSDKDVLTGSCVDFLDGWLNLVEKLLNTHSIIDSPHTIVSSTSATVPPSRQVTFDTMMFIMKAQQVCLKYTFVYVYAHVSV